MDPQALTPPHATQATHRNEHIELLEPLHIRNGMPAQERVEARDRTGWDGTGQDRTTDETKRIEKRRTTAQDINELQLS